MKTKTCITWITGLLAVILGTSSCSTTHDHKQLVWNDQSAGEIVVSNLDGSNQMKYRHPALLIAPVGLAVYTKEQAIFYTSPYLDKILRLDLDDGQVTEIISTGPNTHVADSQLWAIALDEKRKIIYWSENGTDHEGIYRADLEGEEIEQLFDDACNVMDIYLDPTSDKIYWTDNGTDHDRIYRANIDGSGKEIVTSMAYGSPYGLSINPKNGDIYWTDGYQLGISIRKIDTNAKQTETIYDSERGATGLVFDIDAQQLYWLEGVASNKQKIFRADLDGSNITEIHAQNGGYLVDLELITRKRHNRIIQAIFRTFIDDNDSDSTLRLSTQRIRR